MTRNIKMGLKMNFAKEQVKGHMDNEEKYLRNTVQIMIRDAIEDADRNKKKKLDTENAQIKGTISFLVRKGMSWQSAEEMTKTVIEQEYRHIDYEKRKGRYGFGKKIGELSTYLLGVFFLVAVFNRMYQWIESAKTASIYELEQQIPLMWIYLL